MSDVLELTLPDALALRDVAGELTYAANRGRDLTREQRADRQAVADLLDELAKAADRFRTTRVQARAVRITYGLGRYSDQYDPPPTGRISGQRFDPDDLPTRDEL